MFGKLAALWGIIGISALIGSAIWRLGQKAIDAFSYELTWQHYAVMIPWLIFMVVGEGYRGFQKKFSPRVAARAKYLSENPNFLHALLAPFFCMALFHATKKRMIVSYCLLTGIITLIVLIKLYTTQPWTGVIDIGVVAGLAWGLTATYVYVFKAFTDPNFNHDPEVPK